MFEDKRERRVSVREREEKEREMFEDKRERRVSEKKRRERERVFMIKVCV